MKKLMMVLVALTILTSCSTQKQFNGFSKADVITEIAVFDYVPIYQSYLPEAFPYHRQGCGNYGTDNDHQSLNQHR